MASIDQDARWFATTFTRRYEVAVLNDGTVLVTLSGECGQHGWEPSANPAFEELLVATYHAAFNAARFSDGDRAPFQSGLWLADDLLAPYSVDAPTARTFRLRRRPQNTVAELHSPRTRMHHLLADIYCEIRDATLALAAAA